MATPAEISKQRKAFVQQMGYDPSTATKFKMKYQNLRHNAPQRGGVVELTFEDYVILAKEAGLQGPDDIGQGLHKFQLGRLNDTGPYQRGNCRFITQRLNLQEQRDNTRRRRASI